MKTFIYNRFTTLFLIILMGLFLMQCSSGTLLSRSKVHPDASVKAFMYDGKVYEGLVLDKTKDGIVLITEENHQRFELKFKDIRRLERSPKYYDRYGYRISRAEIQKFRTNQNATGFAVGGAVLGGAAGLAIGYPFWVAEIGNVPPYFTAGIGAVIGSILYGIKGNHKDQEIALRKAQRSRTREAELERQKAIEEKRLKEIEKEKKALLKKLQAKKKDS